MDFRARNLAGFADELRRAARASRLFDATTPKYANWPSGIDHRVIVAMEKLAFARPFAHQREAIDLTLHGKNVCLATETASGKTLAYVVPIAAAVAADATSRALILYPTKALAWDQFENVRRTSLALRDQGVVLTGAKYDGDTGEDVRKAVRGAIPNILFTNPDELHHGILRSPSKWSDLFQHLRYVVLDELHAYSGFFGSDVALILRRLRQLCRHHGSDPTFIAASATIENARQHAEAVTGTEFEVIEGSTAGSGAREVFVLFTPDGMASAVHDLVVALTRAGLQSIVFANARVTVERLGERIREDVGAQVAIYRGGYLPEERRRTHEGLKAGTICSVVATNALELGIDVGDLDVAILHGHPGMNAAAWQRIGRVGRNYRRPSLGVVILGIDDPIDRYYAMNPDEFFASRGRPERAVVTPDNPELLRRHLSCALLEAGRRRIPLDLFPPSAGEVLASLSPPSPAHRAYTELDIRFIRRPYEIYDVSSGRVIGTIDGNVAHREAHWQAVYAHGEGRYRIGRRPKGKARIECEPETIAGRVTTPNVEMNAELVKVHESFDWSTTGRPLMPFVRGEVHLIDRTIGFREWSDESPNQIPRVLKHPQGIDLTSEGFAIVLGEDLAERVRAAGPLVPLEVLHGLGHLLVNALVQDGVAGASDLLEYALDYAGELDGPTLYICEAIPGGLGFAKELFDNIEHYLIAARDRVSRCPCRDEAGCPACILLKHRCPQRNIAMRKAPVQAFLASLVGALGKRTAWSPPTPPPRPRIEDPWKPGDTYPGGLEVLDRDADGVVVRLPSGQPRMLRWLPAPPPPEVSEAQVPPTSQSRKRPAQRISGTREWAVENVNIVLGCEHRCRYCYARADARKKKRIASLTEWGTTYHRFRPQEVAKGRKKVDGTIMFPTTHDITPQFLGECVIVLRKLMEAGNDVLIVSKPHLMCIERLCQEFAGYKEKILFRFTIGAMDDNILGFWEPDAPKFAERLAALKHAHEAGFRTSVSAEPMLDSAHVVELFHALAPYVTDSIWIGKMNKIDQRVTPSTPEEIEAVRLIEEGQTDERIKAIYAELKDEPLVRWKESIKEVLGLPLAEEAGLDI